jgi:hypothetical protein
MVLPVTAPTPPKFMVEVIGKIPYFVHVSVFFTVSQVLNVLACPVNVHWLLFTVGTY